MGKYELMIVVIIIGMVIYTYIKGLTLCSG
jgi:hypothetical protein